VQTNEVRKDENKFSFHFNYKVEDQLYYDGDSFSGRVCPGLFASMIPVIHGVFLLGNRYNENIMRRYRGRDTRAPGMIPYDGVGFRLLKTPLDPETPVVEEPLWKDPKTGKGRGAHFLCADHHVLAHFKWEPVDLSDCEYVQLFYRTEIAVLEKIEAGPGILINEIIDRFTPFDWNKFGQLLIGPVMVV